MYRRLRGNSRLFRALAAGGGFTSSVSFCDSRQKYDFVVVGGNGHAGQACLSTLKQANTQHRILSIDTASKHSQETHMAYDFIEASVTSLEIAEKRLTLDDGRQIIFDNVFIATGRYLQPHLSTGDKGHNSDNQLSGEKNDKSEGEDTDLDEYRAMLSDLYGYCDMRLLLSKYVLLMNGGNVFLPSSHHRSSDMNNGEHKRHNHEVTQSEMYNRLCNIVRKGGHVTLIGNGSHLEVYELATRLAREAHLYNRYTNCVTIVTPQAGLLANRLPRYLSLALNRRLSSSGVEVVPYSQIRYIAGSDVLYELDTPLTHADQEDKLIVQQITDKSDGILNEPRVTVFAAHTFDTMATLHFSTDRVILMNIGPLAGEAGSDMEGSSRSSAISQSGKIEMNVLSNGTLNLPNHATHQNQEQDTANDKGDHFAYTAGLERGIGGGVVVNRSLQAAHGIYVGGELANIDPGHTLLGRGQYEGSDHAIMTGKLAAMNMLGQGCHMYKHIPILHTSDAYSGISLTMVGHCHAALDTYGYFYKTSTGSNTSPNNGNSNYNNKDGDRENTSNRVKQNLLGYFGMNREKGPGWGEGGENVKIVVKGKEGVKRTKSKKADKIDGNAQEKKRLMNKHKRNTQEEQSGGLVQEKGDTKGVPGRSPPLGTGIIYYLNDENIILGVLLNGMPASSDKEEMEAILSRARAVIGKRVLTESFSPVDYMEDSPGSDNSGVVKQIQSQFHFGNAGGLRHITVSQQLEQLNNFIVGNDAAMKTAGEIFKDTMANNSNSIRKEGSNGYNHQNRNQERPLPLQGRPSIRILKGSASLQREQKASMRNDKRVSPVLPTRDKIISTSGHSSVKTRIEQAYSTTLRNAGNGKGPSFG